MVRLSVGPSVGSSVTHFFPEYAKRVISTSNIDGERGWREEGIGGDEGEERGGGGGVGNDSGGTHLMFGVFFT